MKRRFNITNEQLRHFLNEETIPLSALGRGPGILECICLYLKGEGYRPRVIAKKLNRSYTTITNTLLKAKQKPLRVPKEWRHLDIPLAIFSQREKAPLQALVSHLHDEEGMRFTEIAEALGRDARNIGDTYRRARRK